MDGEVRSVVRSPLSRPLQEVTVCRYTDRIREEGLSQIVGFGVQGLRFSVWGLGFEVRGLGFKA